MRRPSVCCCAGTKNTVIAKYALRGQPAPIGVAEWATRLTEQLPPELATSLPSIETLEAELSDATNHA